MNLNIRLKLILFTFCIVLLVGGSISLYSIYLGRHRILGTFENDGQEITTLIAGAIVNDLYFLDLRSLRHRLESARVNPDISYTYAMDLNGVVLTDGTATNALRDQRLTDPFSEEVLRADSWRSRIEGGLLKVGGPIFMPDGSRIGHLQIGFSLHHANQLVHETTKASFYLTVFCFGIGVVLAFMVATNFSRPILSIMRASKKIGEGRLDTRLPVNRRDELGTLAESVNQMAEALQTRHTEVKRAEEALRETEERSRLLLETTNAIPWEASAETWQFTYVGPQAARILGYPVDEWYQKDFWASHIHPEDLEYAVDFCLKSSSRCRHYEFEYRMIRRDGSAVWLHDIVSVESVNGVPKKLRGFMIDITERKLETKKIQHKTKELSMLHDINLAVSSTLDLQNVLNLLVEKTAQLLPYSSAFISLYNQSKGGLETIASRNLHTSELSGSMRRIGGKSFAQRIFASKTPIVVKDLQTDPRVRDPEFARRHGLKSYAGMPLVVQGKSLGVLGFYTKVEHDFSGGEVEFLTTLASQAAIAIHNSQLYENITEKTIELQKANQQLSVLYSISNTINESANLESMLQSVMRAVLEIFHFDAARVYLLDSQSNELRLNSYLGFPSWAHFAHSYRLGESVTGKVLEKGEPLFFEDLGNDLEYRAMTISNNALKAGFRSTFRIPIKIKEKTVGVLSFFGKRVHRFSTSERELIQSIANHVGVAVEKANLFEEIRARVNELSALYAVSSTISNSLETDHALSGGMQKIQEIFGFESARIYLFDEKEGELRLLTNEGRPDGFVPSSSIKPGEGALGKVFEEGRLIYFEDIQTDPNYLQLHPSGKALKAGFRGSLSIPIRAKNKVTGVMNFSSKSPHRFTAAEIQLIESIANNFGTVIENLYLFQEVRSRSKELQKSGEELQRLTGDLLSAQEDERRRLARELHDDLTQRLAVLAIEAGKLEQQSDSSPDLIRERLPGMKEQIVKLSADIHRISRQLHPSILDDLGLVDAIKSLCTVFSEQEGILVEFTPEKLPEELTKDVSLCLYRVTQESLRNIAKHAQAKEAHVTLASNNGSVLLSIQDSGAGFDPAQARRKPGLGLASMEERVRLIQGSLSVQSQPAHGTTIEVRAPLARRDV